MGQNILATDYTACREDYELARVAAVGCIRRSEDGQRADCRDQRLMNLIRLQVDRLFRESSSIRQRSKGFGLLIGAVLLVRIKIPNERDLAIVLCPLCESPA